MGEFVDFLVFGVFDVVCGVFVGVLLSSYVFYFIFRSFIMSLFDICLIEMLAESWVVFSSVFIFNTLGAIFMVFNLFVDY